MARLTPGSKASPGCNASPGSKASPGCNASPGSGPRLGGAFFIMPSLPQGADSFGLVAKGLGTPLTFS